MAIEVNLVSADQDRVRQEVVIVGASPEVLSDLTLVTSVIELPEIPEEGTWTLKAVDGVLTWVEEEGD